MYHSTDQSDRSLDKDSEVNIFDYIPARRRTEDLGELVNNQWQHRAGAGLAQ